MQEQTKVIIRDADSGSDHAFLYSTWRHALWYAEKRNQREADNFYKEASEKVSAALKGPGTRVRMACLNDDHDMLLGWSVMRLEHLHFVYVKIDYRGKGIGRLLTKGFKTFDEPQTKIGKSLAEKFLKEKNGRNEGSKEAQAQPQAD